MDYTRKSYLLEKQQQQQQHDEEETYFHHQKKHSHLHRHHLPHLNTSFSSSLLDEIYKSFDETTTTYKSSCFEETTTTIMKKKMTCIAPVSTTSRSSTNKNHSNGASVRGAGGGVIRDFEESAGRLKQRNVVDKWVLEEKKKKKKKEEKENEKQVVENHNKFNLRKKPALDTHRYFHSTSTSSDSSSGGGFSSSETESVYGSKTNPSTKSATKTASASFFVKPIRTRGSSTVHHSEKTDQILRNQSKSNGDDESRSGGGNGKTKSRAMKIYNDLIKVKQPISPGGKISSFLTSLFTPKKSSNLVDTNDFPSTTKSTFTRTAPPVAAATPTCSSASLYSRSCLSKTPSLANGKQRSVRFYPVNIIVDDKHEVSKPSREESHRHHYQQRSRNGKEEFKNKISTIKNNHQKLLIEEVIDIDKLLMRNYQRTDDNLKVEEDVYDDDRASYASSDLFELENLSTIGLENAAARFSEELPVYETTHFETNRAIANGFRL